MNNDILHNELRDNFNPECLAKAAAQLSCSKDKDVLSLRDTLVDTLGGGDCYSRLIMEIEG